MRRLTRKHVGCLVALGVVSVLAGLFLATVPRVRDAAARSRCQNNFKQLLLAAHGYADTNRDVFPPGTFPNPNLPPERRLSWHFAIVPYVEASNLYRRVDQTMAWDDPKNQSPLGEPFWVYRCSTIPREDTRPITTYAGVTGLGADSPTLPLDHARAGIFGYDRRTPLAAIKDGTSETILVMEYGREPVPWAKGGEGTLAWFDPTDPPHHGPGRPFGMPHGDTRPLFSRRDKCGNVGFADGSVRTVRDTVSPGVLEGLATIAGGEAVVFPE